MMVQRKANKIFSEKKDMYADMTIFIKKEAVSLFYLSKTASLLG